jgi:hypothetical protein
MFTRRALTGIVALGALGALATKSQAQAHAGRRAEVEALRRFAEATHPRGREASADGDWRSRWDNLAADADRLSDGLYFVRTRRALGWFEDGHTTLLPFEFVGGVPPALASGPFSLSLPLRVRMFHDGAYVTSAKEEAAPLLGARLDQIGAAEAGALVRASAEQWPGSDAWAHRWAAEAFSSPTLLEAFGAVADPRALVQARASLGRRRLRASLRPRADAGDGLLEFERTRTAPENWTQEAGVENYARILQAERAIYISLDSMDNLEGKSFEAFTRECFAAIENASPERLIVDLRRNGGGDNFLPEALRKQIGRSRFNRPGGLYVLTAPSTFSAAQNLANRLERETFALFVGEPTGGAPNHYGDAATFTGEATGLTWIVSTLPWFDSYPQDHRQWIFPDIFAPRLFEDWRQGRDAALQAALSHRVAAPLEDLSEDRVFYFGRSSQAALWRPFWRPAEAEIGTQGP